MNVMTSIETTSVLGRRADGADLTLDVKALIGQHMLLQAATGGGKSFALRKVMELALQAQVPVLVFDVEDEFGTLKDIFPDIAVVGGEDGDVSLMIERVPELARTALRNGTSVIVKVGTADNPGAVVARWVEAIMAAPRDLWRPLLVALDEAQKFAPEGQRSESRKAIDALLQQGRKRGYTAVLATQRFANVAKSCLTQASNVLAGRVANQADVKRAEGELRLDGTAAALLPALSRGHFFACGPALSPNPVLIGVSPTLSHHGVLLPDPATSVRAAFDVALMELKAVAGSVDSAVEPVDAGTKGSPHRPARPPKTPGASATVATAAPADPRIELGDGARRLLTIVAVKPGLSMEAAGILVGRKSTGKAFAGLLVELRARGLLRLTSLRLTAAGEAWAREHVPVGLTVAALLAERRQSLGREADRVLDALRAAAPAAVTRDDLAAHTGLSPRSRKLKGGLIALERSGMVRRVGDRYAATPGLIALTRS